MEDGIFSPSSASSIDRPPNGGLLLDVGRQPRKHIDRLKWGAGPLLERALSAIHEKRGDLGINPTKGIVPVILLYCCVRPEYTVSLFSTVDQIDEEKNITNVTTPIVVDLGKTRNEDIGRLRIGGGRIADEVEEVMCAVRLTVDLDDGIRVLLPVVVVYSRERMD
jgi:hypothetical protein